MRKFLLLIAVSALLVQCGKDSAEVTVNFLINGEDIKPSVDIENAPNRIKEQDKIAFVALNERIKIKDVSTPQEAIEQRLWKINHSIYEKADQEIDQSFDEEGFKPIILEFNGIPQIKWIYVYDIAKGDPRDLASLGNSSSMDEPAAEISVAPKEEKAAPEKPQSDLIPTVKKKEATGAELQRRENERLLAEAEAKREREEAKRKEIERRRQADLVAQQSKQQSSNSSAGSTTSSKSATSSSTTSSKTSVPPPPPPTKPKVSSVSFRSSKTTADVGDAITFTDQSSPVSAIERRVWEFGDGTQRVSSSAGVTHSYNQAGSYTVSLCINGDPSLCKTTVVKINALEIKEAPKPPVAAGPFKCNIKGIGGVRSSTICSSAGSEVWSDGATLTLKPKKRLELLEAKIKVKTKGSVTFTLYEEGEEIGEIESFFNPGMNQALLDEFFSHLEPNKSYKLKISPSSGQQLENIAGCNPGTGSGQHIDVGYAGQTILFDLKYCYQ